MAIEFLTAISSVTQSSNFLEMGSNISQPSDSSSFFNMISEKLHSIDHSIKESDSLMQAYIKGENIPVHDIMIALGKAKTEIQLAVEIRNKLLESYQEITRIQL
jgi:flagellar hook-basal body complex protein FliE